MPELEHFEARGGAAMASSAQPRPGAARDAARGQARGQTREPARGGVG
jgi:hypothetical protein